MQRTTQRRKKLLDLSVAGSLVKEILLPDVTLSVDKTKLFARLVPALQSLKLSFNIKTEKQFLSGKKQFFVLENSF